MPAELIHLLLVEDNPGDVVLTQEALEGALAANQLHVAEDGQTALDFLRRINGHESAPRPDLVLLDLNLPVVEGKDVLRAMKDDEDLRSIPVVIMSSSDAERDIRDTYLLHANCYIQKPFDLDQFIEVVKTLEAFWLRVARLPPH